MRNRTPLLPLMASLALSACGTPQGESIYNRLHMGPDQRLSKARPPARIPITVRRYNRPNDLGLAPHLFELRKAMINGKEISDADLQEIADTGDAYAAWTYAERLYARAEPADTFKTIQYYARAADQGRAGGIPRIIELTNTDAFDNATPEQLDRVEGLLRTYALRKRDTQAALFLVQRYNLGTPFGEKSEDVVDLLETLADGGDVRIALRLATQILQTRDMGENPEQRAKARRYLTIAAEAENISIQTTALNLLAMMDRQDGAPPAVAEERSTPTEEQRVATGAPDATPPETNPGLQETSL